MAPDLPVKYADGGARYADRRRDPGQRDQAREPRGRMRREPTTAHARERRADRRTAQESAGAEAFGAQLETWRARMEARAGGAASGSRRGAGAPARGHALQRAGRRQAHPAGVAVRHRAHRGLCRKTRSRRRPAPSSWCTCTRWCTTICRRWTTTICAAAGRPATRPTMRRPRCWWATRCSRWHFNCSRAIRTLPASPAIRLRLIDLLAQAIGTFGMAGGQAIDLAVQGMRLDIGQVEDMHARKTGALIRASVLMAAECAPSLDPSLYGALDALCDGRRSRLSDSGRPARCDRRCVDAGQGHRRRQRARQTHASGGHRHLRPRSSACGCCTIRRSMRSRPSASVPSRCAPWPTGCCRGSTDAR